MGVKNKSIRIVGASAVLAVIALGWLWLELGVFGASPIPIDSESHFVIESGSHLRKLGRKLEQDGIIDSASKLYWLARIQRRADKIQVGEYAVVPGTTHLQLLDKIVEGKVLQYSLTLVEGWNIRQVLDAVKAHPQLGHTLQGVDETNLMEKLGLPGQHPEGRFFPDTYHFPRGLSDVAFFRRAYEAMDKNLAMLWVDRDGDLPYEQPYQALVMASIVEKETGLPSERQAIAGVFVRRLEKGMRLQTDPTVIYGLGANFDGNIRRADLTRDTPYNTYVHKGLPPTPIAMPGRDAIYAALHPDDSEAIYFVARGDGSHHFSATLEEHNRAVVKYQLKGRKRPFSSSP